MITYKYCVHDDDHNILDKCFDNFADAFDYAQKGLITFIEEVPFIDGVEDEDNSEVVWTWDDVRDRDAAINYVCNRHRDFDDFDTQIQSDELISSEYDYPIDEDISVEVEADDPEDLAEFARCILGDNFESFDQEFDEIVPDAEIKLEPREVSEALNESSKRIVIGKYIDPNKENYEDIEYSQYPNYDEHVEVIGGQTVDVEIYPTYDSLGHSFYFALKTTDGGFKHHSGYLFNLHEFVNNGKIVLNSDWKLTNKYPYLQKVMQEDLNDNAVKDCKNYKLVAHCKEEKPVCNIEKPVLPDELTDPDLDMTDEEFYEAFGKALKDKVENK